MTNSYVEVPLPSLQGPAAAARLQRQFGPHLRPQQYAEDAAFGAANAADRAAGGDCHDTNSGVCVHCGVHAMKHVCCIWHKQKKPVCRALVTQLSTACI